MKITGRVVRPLTTPVATIRLVRRVSCHKVVLVKRFKPRADGTFTVTVRAPKGQARRDLPAGDQRPREGQQPAPLPDVHAPAGRRAEHALSRTCGGRHGYHPAPVSTADAPPATRPSARERDLLRRLAAGTAGVVGDAFLRAMVRHLAAAFGAELAFIGEHLPAPAEGRVRVLARWQDGVEMAEGYEFDIDDTMPCAVVRRDGLLVLPDGTCARLPGRPLRPRLRAGLLPRRRAAGRRRRARRLRRADVLAADGARRGRARGPADLRRARRRRDRAPPPPGRAAHPRRRGRRRARPRPGRRRRRAPAHRPRPPRRRPAADRRARPPDRDRAPQARRRRRRRRAGAAGPRARGGARWRPTSCASWPAACTRPG